MSMLTHAACDQCSDQPEVARHAERKKRRGEQHADSEAAPVGAHMGGFFFGERVRIAGAGGAETELANRFDDAVKVDGARVERDDRRFIRIADGGGRDARLPRQALFNGARAVCAVHARDGYRFRLDRIAHAFAPLPRSGALFIVALERGCVIQRPVVRRRLQTQTVDA